MVLATIVIVPVTSTAVVLTALNGRVLSSLHRDPWIRETDSTAAILKWRYWGNASATGSLLVEFADFQCPACRGVQPRVSALLQRHRGLKLILHNYPLPQHELAASAAAAAEAARTYGVYDAFCRRLWKVRSLEEGTLLKIASDLNLPRAAFLARMSKAKPIVAKDYNMAVKIGVLRTPFFFLITRDGKVFRLLGLPDIDSLL
jgi:protein-disulfide isomerase